MEFAMARTGEPALRRRKSPETGRRMAARPADGGAVLQRCACGGGCPACRARAAAAAAGSLPVNTPGDAYEREADKVADAVMAGAPAAASARGAGAALRRCSCGGSCPSCREKKDEETLRRDAAGAGAGPAFAPPVVHDVLASPGRPLEGGVRSFMEERMGADFGGVRVHTGARAAESARAVDAHAYTVGSDVVFADGAYRPGTPSGDRLIAHELAHVVQQGGGHAPPMVSRYRPKKGSVNFGACDGGGLTEEEFTAGKPWIEQINVHFDKADPTTRVPTGTISATYHGGTPAGITGLPVTGGDPGSGLTDKGDFKVLRIEGCGYHNLGVPTAEGVPGDKRHKYFSTANLAQATMSFALFFRQGKSSGNQAIHQGLLNTASLACVHVGDVDKLRQLNYHSRLNKTKVTVTYDAKALTEACCARHAAAGFMPSNPCGGVKKASCPKPAATP